MNKAALRKEYKAKRAALYQKECELMDDLMLLKFQQFNYSQAQTVLSYWPITSHAEPNTFLYTGYLKHMVPDILLAHPLTDPATCGMAAVAVTEDTVYHTSPMGLTEPKEGAIIDPLAIDIVFVPLLICDMQGFRVGFGKGFYDRYLANCREDVVKIGFSYFEPVDQIADTTQFDVPLTYCITPEQIYEF